MFSLTISFGPGPTMWTLMFRSKEKAEEIWNCFPIADSGKQIIVEDDFGQRACLTIEDVHGVMLEDMDKSKLAHIERALHQARTQAQAQDQAQSDSALRASAARQHGGPAILTPGMPHNGGFPR